jgi:hypothetical protein
MKNKNSKTGQPVRYLSIKELSADYLISPRRFEALVRACGVKIYVNQAGQPHILENDAPGLALSPLTKTESIKAILAHARNNRSHEYSARRHQELNKKLCKKHKDTIKILESMHKKYSSKIDVLKSEDGKTAAYILFSKIIRLLNMTNDMLSKKYWEASNLLRPIDEANYLCQYFVLSESRPQTKKHIQEWFRLNRIPKIAEVRAALVEVEQSSGSEPSAEFKWAIDRVYHLKSKIAHHNHNSIMESSRLVMKKNSPIAFDYGKSHSWNKVFEMTAFFEYSVWTSVQTFALCFWQTIPLTEAEITKLKNLNAAYQAEL